MAESKLRSYAKSFALTHKEMAEIFNGTVLVQEKVDGSQFSFGVYDGELKVRSKGREFDALAADSLFSAACETVLGLKDKLIDGWTYRGEVLCKPKHNTLKYDRVPKGNIIIFDIDKGTEDYLSQMHIDHECRRLGLEPVPCFYEGKDGTSVGIKMIIDTQQSVLGGPIEGVVIKNHGRFGTDGKILFAKVVSDSFKEVHGKEWKVTNPSKSDVIDSIVHNYKTDARWNKAIQHLRDEGKLVNAPNDIPALMKEVVSDLRQECRAEIGEALLAWAMPQIERQITRGLPEFYKEQLEQSL